ncbi:MAG TPA: calcium/sodium antiporter [Crenotrichaceae bacterium]|nr:calcium/sodium antiporter [Crenotrichaceae bacterium]
MLLTFFLLIVALAGLVVTADRFVEGCAAIANNFGLAPIIIGVTIIGLGTSAPEMLVSGIAAMEGNVGLAIGNALGSNVANIGLILGITLLIKPIAVQSSIFRCEIPALLIVTLGACVLVADYSLDRIDGVALVLFLVVFLAWLVKLCISQNKSDPMIEEIESELPETMSSLLAFGWTIGGLVGLILSSKLLVWAAVSIAQAFGVSDLIIGLTIIALGTSLPELAASIASVLKNNADMAIGNVIGSNIYNLTAVLSIPALLAPTKLAAHIVNRDFLVMGLFTVLLCVLVADVFRRGKLGRTSGFALLFLYCGYQLLLFYSIQS